MPDIAIRVDNLGKKYLLRHQQAGRRYVALRDVLAQKARSLASFNRSGRPAQSATVEEFWALQDVSFEIKQGEAVGIIGRNGAGKSTLLKILSRITEPTQGRIEIDGRVASLLEVGTGFHPELTGRENIYLNGAILGMARTEIRRNFDEIVAFAEVEKFLDTPVKRYSSGMYMRLAFAVAAHLQPEILILDEVLAVGDAQFQQKCLGKMESAGRSGRTILFVSHNMAAIRNLCTSAYWLHQGRLLKHGPVSEVMEDYMKMHMAAELLSLDLRYMPRPPFVDLRVALQHVTFNDGEQIFHGEPFKVEIDAEIRSPVQGISVGFGFSGIDGTRLLSFDSDLCSPRRDLPGAGLAHVTAQIESLPLQPGHYAVDLGIRSGDTTGIDYLPSCTLVEVLPGPRTPSFINNGTCGVRLPARWEFDNNRLPISTL